MRADLQNRDIRRFLTEVESELGILKQSRDNSAYNRPFQGFRRHLGGDAVAAKITANVWEIVQLSNLVTPLLYNEA